ncbi:ArsR/SmtB family transcription factor [Paenibacillus sp. GYB003]|uniref:ArsR/SmtB family transcription factor n=1 Tax=Paenibacillus sp. GYB003 TaxID=2994392 RepID=UPI002F96D05E
MKIEVIIMARDVCDVYCFDEQKVARGKQFLSGIDAEGMTRLFKALADETRLRIALALCQEDELCVCDVANMLGSAIANVSHHLRSLRNMGIAKHRKEGKLVFYSLKDDRVKRLVMSAQVRGNETLANV